MNSLIVIWVVSCVLAVIYTIGGVQKLAQAGAVRETQLWAGAMTIRGVRTLGMLELVSAVVLAISIAIPDIGNVSIGACALLVGVQAWSIVGDVRRSDRKGLPMDIILGLAAAAVVILRIVDLPTWAS